MSLIDSLILQGYLKTSGIIQSFRKIKRADFIPEKIKDLAELDEALPIGYGQTISQPLVVAFMFELLEPKPGEKILDVGSGSGWTTALLAHCVNRNREVQSLKSEIKKGRVIAVEIVPELKHFGEKNVAKYNFIKKGAAEFVCADGSKGYKKEAPFDKILASASAQELSKEWKEQLKINGRIVTPIGTSIWLFVKKSADKFIEKEYPGFVFVPLLTK